MLWFFFYRNKEIKLEINELEIPMQKRWQREKKNPERLFFLIIKIGKKEREKGTMTSFAVVPTLVEYPSMKRNLTISHSPKLFIYSSWDRRE